MSFVFFTAIAATPWTLHPYFLPLYIYSALLHWLYWALELDIHFGVLKCSIWKHPQNTGLEWSHINSHLVFTCCHIAIFFSVVLGIEGKHERRWVPLDMVLSSGMSDNLSLTSEAEWKSFYSVVMWIVRRMHTCETRGQCIFKRDCGNHYCYP